MKRTFYQRFILFSGESMDQNAFHHHILSIHFCYIGPGLRLIREFKGIYGKGLFVRGVYFLFREYKNLFILSSVCFLSSESTCDRRSSVCFLSSESTCDRRVQKVSPLMVPFPVWPLITFEQKTQGAIS